MVRGMVGSIKYGGVFFVYSFSFILFIGDGSLYE